MTDVAIAGLPAATSVLDSDLIIVEEVGSPNVTKRGTAAQMRANSLPLAGGTLTGELIINAGGIAVTGASQFNNTVTLNAGGGWSSNNVGKQLLVTTPAGVSNPGIGITDTNGANPWGVWNNAGVLKLSVMPAYSDGATGPTNIASLSSSGIAVTGTLSSSGALTVTSGGATVTAGGLTVSAGGAAITGNSAITGALTVSTAGTSGNQVVNFSQFAPSASGSGYTKLPGGLVLQWGSASSGAAQDFAVLFPIAFPSAVFSITAIVQNTTDAATNRTAVSGFSASGFACHIGSAGLTVFWMAVGN